jgi:hypothetical protein
LLGGARGGGELRFAHIDEDANLLALFSNDPANPQPFPLDRVGTIYPLEPGLWSVEIR